MKKCVILFAAVMLAAAVLCACAAPAGTQAAAAESQEWSITVEGAERTAFTNEDYDQLNAVKLEIGPLDTHCSDGKSHVWEGVPLKDVIGALGVKDYTSITLTASDDYTKDYTPDVVNDSKTILATVMDGTPLSADEGFVEAIAAGEKANTWVKKLASITVNK